MKYFFSLLLITAMASSASGQTAAALEGRLVSSLSGDPIAGAAVVIDELKREVSSGPDGTFHFDGLEPGTYHLWVRAQGYSSRRTEVTVPTAGAPVELRVDFDLHFQEVASVSAEARSQFDAFQPTTVLSGQELSKQLESSLGATLENQPGIASRSFGSAPSRPVIRGLDGDRVQILQDGQRTGDLSSQSGDHGVSVNPASADRIEVVRGPATLLYGANAIGGLVNIITSDVPTRPVQGSSGEVTFDVGTAAEEAGGAGHVQLGNGKFAVSIGGGGREADDYQTPLGEVINSQSRTAFTTVGGAWTGDKAHFGASYGYDDTKYGIPVVEGEPCS
jgi:iron complex outermembrane recepter protein